MILAIIQARCGSTRLPGKVLAPLLGRPLLARQLERVRRAHRLDRVVVATSDEPGDDPIARLCGELDTPCFRGSHLDVLDRFARAAAEHAPGHVVRLTGDCPLTDPAVVDLVVARHLAEDNDYTSNAHVRSWPDGLDVEVLRAPVLETAAREAVRPAHREHVTPFVHEQPERFRLGVVRHEPDLSRLRWVVDEARDLALVRRIFAALYPENPAFGMSDVLALLERDPTLRGPRGLPGDGDAS